MAEQLDEENPLALTKRLPPDLLLVIFIHGFKGTDTTFAAFPERLQHVLSETIDNVVVECIVFPAYETKGDLKEAVEQFADWLTTLTVEKEVANGTGGGAGKAKIVLCGHSMGGLLAADALLEIANSRPDKQAPLWPKIVACLAFDTPYLGLHPYVFKNSATKAAEYANTAKSIASGVFSSFAALGGKKGSPPGAGEKPSVARIASVPMTDASGSGWNKWGPAAYAMGGALVAGAAAGTAYYRRDDLGMGYAWATDHMKYVRNLWDEGTLRKRIENLDEIEQNMGVIFRNLYTYIPATPPVHNTPRTFIVLPSKSSGSLLHFVPARNSLASDELQAHTGMFEARTNDGYYELGLETAKLIREAVMIGRGVFEGREMEAVQDQAAGEAMNEPLDVGDSMQGPDSGQDENPWEQREETQQNLVDL